MKNGSYEIRVCAHCFDPKSDMNEEVNTVAAGDEAWDVCPSCRTIEGDTLDIVVDGNNNVLFYEEGKWKK